MTLGPSPAHRNQWHDLGEVAAPPDVPDVARARELTAVVGGDVAEGDQGAADRDPRRLSSGISERSTPQLHHGSPTATG